MSLEMSDVKLLREALNVKQFHISGRLGLNQSNYANVENGRLLPKNIQEIKIKALNLLLPYLDLKINNTEKHLVALKDFKNKINHEII